MPGLPTAGTQSSLVGSAAHVCSVHFHDAVDMASTALDITFGIARSPVLRRMCSFRPRDVKAHFYGTRRQLSMELEFKLQTTFAGSP